MKRNALTVATEAIRTARRVVALTGAGISTPSGIPDFRSSAGLWAGADPASVASLPAFRRDPGRFYRWFQPLIDVFVRAEPNPAHVALATLERRGTLAGIITQNIDGLHQLAGSREVYELHGNVRHATCQTCLRQVPTAPLLRQMLAATVPRCDCGGVFKPDVVLFGEDLPRGLFWLAQRAIEQCDTLIVAGTSLEVWPVNEMPLAALQRGARIIVVNRTPTYLDDRADAVIHGDVAEILPLLAAD